MSDIVACYAVFNEADHIAESIRSVKAYVDRFVVIDSAFASNPIAATHSTDATRQIVERLCAAAPAKPLEYVEATTKLVEHVARNVYVDLVREPDWCLVIDGDEILYGDYAAIRATFDAIRSGEMIAPAIDVPVYTVALNANKEGCDVTPDEWENNPLISTMGLMPRLFRAAPTLRYESPGAGYNTPVLTYRPDPRKRWHLAAKQAVPPWSMFLVNHHAGHGQTLEGYKADYVWETAR